MSSSEKAIDIWVEKLIPSLESNLYKLYKGGKTERFFHPKMHGCLKAEFIVSDDLTPRLRKGVFASPRTFPAWIRFSNSSHRSKSDMKQNYHGMAIKLMDVEGKKLLEGQEKAETQDFIMVNSPVLNARSLKNAAQAVLASNGNIFVKLWFLITHLGEIIRTLKKSPYTNLLHSKYYSQVPISFGEAEAIKFAAIPVDPHDPDILHHNDPDYLRKQMIAELAEKDIWFDFAVQFQEDPKEQPIEDPSVEWSSVFHKVASIRIPRQDFYTESQSMFGEHLSFNPWHGIKEHKPLGKINIARGDIYKTLSEYRHNLNGIKVFEPTSATKPESILTDDFNHSRSVDLFPAGTKTYQSQFTAIIPVDAEKAPDLNKLLIKIGEKVSQTEDSIFSRLRTVHYCRFFIVDKAKNPDKSPLSTQLVFSVVFDGSLSMTLNDLFVKLGNEVNEIFSFCKNYTGKESVEEKIVWIKEFRNKEKLFWPAKKGGTVSMILNESALQKKIQDFLDETYKKEDLSKLAPKMVYQKILEFIKSQADLRWALQPEPDDTFVRKLLNALNLVFVLISIAVLIIPILAIWTPLTIYFNKQDRKKYNDKSTDEDLRSLKEVLDWEDNFYQNQLTIYASIKKPLWFRAANLKLFLFFANNSMRYKATKGSLGGISSIHFVSWSMFNNGKNGMFLSNYDNGWQSYLSEFIDKAAAIMNRSFGNLAGYPPITGLNKDGAYDEQKFKEIVRKYQFPCPVWYSAYPQISVTNVISNSKIRQGLSAKMSEEDLRKWLQLF